MKISNIDGKVNKINDDDILDFSLEERSKTENDIKHSVCEMMFEQDIDKIDDIYPRKATQVEK